VTAISQLLNIGTVGGFNSIGSDKGPAQT